MPFDNAHLAADFSSHSDTFNDKCCFAIKMLHSIQDSGSARISPALTLYVKNLILRNNWRRTTFSKVIYDVLKSI